ncbi:ABC transporter permease [Anaerobacillus alkaliphilus]|uniref:ABC transporter permease n=1 Tax=Anaerobacillus alkaliphilus TaxID=1548597 RepID=A0A4Q0VPK7_9BACI|nr:ABC transporter permease [Anaerobacillus alkaliphilus]RXI97845.1 ABC transporter permease [Anaerobacillus alkaliphilus]
MGNFIRLLQNENMKIYRRPGTWMMFGILVAVLLIVAVVTRFLFDQPVNGSWQEVLAAKNAQYQMMIDEGAMPKVALENYEREIKLNEYRLEHDIPPVDTNSFWGYMMSTVNLISIVTLFTIIVAAGTVASEFSWGTIKLLLIRPASRSKILLSKYLSTFIFAILMLVVLFMFSLASGAIFFDATTITQPHLIYNAGEVYERNMFLHLFLLYGLSSVDLLMMVTFAFMISTIFRSSSLAIGLALFLMFTGSQLVFVLSQYDWVKYVLFANTYLAQYIEGSPIVEGMTMTFSITMLFIYFVIFNTLSWVIFQKRDVAG